MAPLMEGSFARDSAADFSKTSLLNRTGAISIKDASKRNFKSLYGDFGLKNNDYSTCSMANTALASIPDIHGDIKRSMAQLAAEGRANMHK